MYLTKFALIPLLAIACATARGDFESASELYQNRDYSGAYAEFLPLAEAGNPRAQTVIALMNKYGESVPPDPVLAFSWYQKAARSGYAPAQYYVGEMYADGSGVKPDRNAAIEWLSKAAAQGFKRAATKLESLSVDPLEIVGKDAATGELALKDPTIAWNFRLPNEVRNNNAESGVSPPTSNESYLVQVGAMGTQAGANRLWEWFTVQAPALFEDRDPIVQLADDTDKRTYVVAVGPFDDFREASGFCERLRQSIREAGCLPLRQH